MRRRHDHDPTSPVSRWARGAVLLTALAAGASATGCKAKNVRAPYEATPDIATLLDAARPPLQALQVSRARVRQRAGSATLMFAAMSPDRFRGTVQIAGNELFSLAVHEDAYELRITSGKAGQVGFYEGPPSACAISALIGVPLLPEELVTVLLGGVPLAVDERTATRVDQRWARRRPGHEILTLEGEGVRQELRFRWIDGEWRFAGTEIRRRRGGRWQTEVMVKHTDFMQVDDRWIVERTELSVPDGDGELQRVRIHLQQVRVDPPSLLGDTNAAPDSGDPGSGDTTASPAPTPDTWDDTWDDDGDDAGDDEGGANEGASEGLAPGADTAADPADLRDTPGERPDPPSAQGAPLDRSADRVPEIPAVFRLSRTGLPSRGDLCADPGADTRAVR